jgi:hypothetical protein
MQHHHHVRPADLSLTGESHHQNPTTKGQKMLTPKKNGRPLATDALGVIRLAVRNGWADQHAIDLLGPLMANSDQTSVQATSDQAWAWLAANAVPDGHQLLRSVAGDVLLVRTDTTVAAGVLAVAT